MDEAIDLTAATPADGPVRTRAEAYQRLREASEFLLRTEPHSPVPYLIRRAIAWGNMTLAEVLEELLSKNADLPTIYALLGIKRS
jgi:type VI secretion system protein ImpA